MAIDPHLLDKAAGDGRIRGIALSAWREAKKSPERAGPILRKRVRSARALHSRERRLVQDALYGLLRQERFLARVLGTEVPEALWLGWLVTRGLDTERAASEQPADYAALAEATPRDLAEAHSIPAGLYARLCDQWSLDEVAAFLEASDQRAPLTVRTNRLRGTRDDLAARFAELDISTTPTAHAPDGLHIEGRRNLEATPLFREGWFEVQDEGSQLLAELVEPDGPVIDFCAGAGGKSLALASHGVPVLGLDVRSKALAELRKRADRADADVTTAVLRDGQVPKYLARRTASRVLVDAPCTGTGVLRRHPEHRWQFNRRWLKDRVRLQEQILSRASRHVSPGGWLVYGTCSVLAEEDERVVERFLERHRGFQLDEERVLRVAPHTHGTDGFFGAVLRRR